MSFIRRARQVATALFKKSDRSVRNIALETEIPKSSVHRHFVARKKRVTSVGHDFFETEAGYNFLQRLFFAVLFVFGIQAGVGADTIFLFFTVMLLTAYIASSPSSIRQIKNQMRQLMTHYDAEMMQQVLASCKNKSLHLGGDETFFDDQLFLIMMELTSGFIFTEALTKDRQYSTWSAVINACLKGLNNIASMAIDKGRSLLKLGNSLTHVTMDLFHVLQDITRAFGAQFSAKHRSLVKQETTIDKDTTLSAEEKESVKRAINDRQQILIAGEKAYRDSLFSITTVCHPFAEINQPQSSSALSHQLHNTLTALRSVMSNCNISDKRNLINRCENRIAALTPLNDLWHQWVEAALQSKTQDDALQVWVKTYLLPWCYWKWQLSKSKRSAPLRQYYQEKVTDAYAALIAHPLSANHLNDDWISWGKALSLKYQRTTSAVEGRNARLSYHYFSSKGIRAHHVKPLTTLHNFWLKRADHTTACERLCGIKPPDLFEWLLARMDAMPIPRQRQVQAASI